MAEQVGDELGEAIVDLLARAWRRLRPVVRELLDDLAALAKPHPPIFVITVAGEVLTGIAVLEAGKVLAFIGTVGPAPTSRYRDDPYDEPLWQQRSYGR